MTEQARQLKSCPFCGCEDIYLQETGFFGEPAISCGGCRTVLGYPTVDTVEQARQLEKIWENCLQDIKKLNPNITFKEK